MDWETRLQRRQNRPVTWAERKEQARQEFERRVNELKTKTGVINAILAPARLSIAFHRTQWTWMIPPKKYGPYLTYDEHLRIGQIYRMEARHERLLKIFGPLKLYQPHYVPHPKENRLIPYRQWKHLQKMLIWQEKRRLHYMNWQHGWTFRTAMAINWLGERAFDIEMYPLRLAIRSIKAAAPRLQTFAVRYRKRTHERT
jgi:hypothetical protein